MKRPRAPLFLARRSYRRRRMRDGARLLPVFGIFLLCLPLLWTPQGIGLRVTARDGMYFFAIWFGLILVAALMAPGLSDETADDPAGTEDDL